MTEGVPLLRTLLAEDEELAAVAEETEGDLRSRSASATGSPTGSPPALPRPAPRVMQLCVHVRPSKSINCTIPLWDHRLLDYGKAV